MSDTPTMELEHSYRLRIFEAGPGRMVRPSAVADCLQDIAAAHAVVLGFSAQRFADLGLAWVLARMRLALHRAPEPGTDITVRTWPSAVDRAVARREFEITGPAGEPLGAATQAWVALDVARRRLARMPEFVRFGEHEHTRPRPLEFEGKSPPRLAEHQRQARILARRADTDENGHVNNARLMDWLAEPLPDALARTRPWLEADLAFKHECLAGDVVLARTDHGPDDSPEAGGRIVHALVREDGTELVRAATRWGPAA